MARPDVDFVGRGDALTELERALRAVPSVVLVEGEAGIGKTRLVEEFLALHGLEHVLRASGTEQESSIDYGVADQLLRAAGTPLLGAGDPRVVVVGVDLMARFEALDAVVIDDAQWIDGPSMRVLLFALRRLTRVGPLAVFIARDDEGERLPVGLRKLPRTRTVRLSPLRDKDT